VLAVGEVTFWQRRVKGKKVQTGVENLVGATGEVSERLAPSCSIRVLGDLWEAHSSSGSCGRAGARDRGGRAHIGGRAR
jgi:membrane protein implicated in regulation of membrane protease activity